MFNGVKKNAAAGVCCVINKVRINNIQKWESLRQKNTHSRAKRSYRMYNDNNKYIWT